MDTCGSHEAAQHMILDDESSRPLLITAEDNDGRKERDGEKRVFKLQSDAEKNPKEPFQ